MTIRNKRSEATCAVCGAPGLRAVMEVASDVGDDGLVPTTTDYGRALGDISRCSACGHMQVDPMPSVATLDAEYELTASDTYIEEEEGQRATARSLLAEIGRRMETGRMLDAGCWIGFLLDEARLAGWETVGLEPSTWASAWARDRLGLDVRTGTLADSDLEPMSFDVAVLADVIEHLPRPDLALRSLADALRPGGVVALIVPDAGSRVARLLGRRWWSVIPTHVHYFTRDSIRVLLEQGGFRDIRITTAPKTFSVRYYLGRLSGYSTFVGRLTTAVADRLGFADRMITPDFRDRMLVLATRGE